jgi:hypothetical protein
VRAIHHQQFPSRHSFKASPSRIATCASEQSFGPSVLEALDHLC